MFTSDFVMYDVWYLHIGICLCFGSKIYIHYVNVFGLYNVGERKHVTFCYKS